MISFFTRLRFPPLAGLTALFVRPIRAQDALGAFKRVVSELIDVADHHLLQAHGKGEDARILMAQVNDHKNEAAKAVDLRRRFEEFLV